LRLLLDGKSLEVANWSFRTVQDLVSYLEGQVVPEGRVIESISVGGIELYDWSANTPICLPEHVDIHVKTQAVAELLASAIETAAEYVPKLEAGAVAAATLFQQGRADEAFVVTRQLVEGLEWYCEFLGSVSTLLPQHERSASARLSSLNAVLEHLVEAWEARDHTLLADLLEYELAAELQTNREYLAELAKFNAVGTQNQ